MKIIIINEYFFSFSHFLLFLPIIIIIIQLLLNMISLSESVIILDIIVYLHIFKKKK